MCNIITITRKCNEKTPTPGSYALLVFNNHIFLSRFSVSLHSASDIIKLVPKITNLYSLILSFIFPFSNKLKLLDIHSFTHRIRWQWQWVYVYIMWQMLNSFPLFHCVYFNIHDVIKEVHFVSFLCVLREIHKFSWLRCANNTSTWTRAHYFGQTHTSNHHKNTSDKTWNCMKNATDQKLFVDFSNENAYSRVNWKPDQLFFQWEHESAAFNMNIEDSVEIYAFYSQKHQRKMWPQ